MSVGIGKHLKLAGLAFLGLCTVSIPVTIAVVLSATGASNVLSLEGFSPVREHQTPVKSVSRMRCVPQHGYYALTFEDGPDARTTRRLVAALRRARAVATFFDVGERAAAHPELVELQRSVGHVASHSWSHERLGELSRERRISELQAAAKALDYPNALFRPPFGEYSPDVDRDIVRSGLTPVYWTVDTYDAALPRDAIVALALEVRAGGIVRLHDGVGAAVDAIPEIVAGLRRRGMCPGFLAGTAKTIVAENGARFHVIAVRP